MSKEYFYHFTNADAAKKILWEGRLNASSILKLNDPFDTASLSLSIDCINEHGAKKFLEILKKSSQYPGNVEKEVEKIFQQCIQNDFLIEFPDFKSMDIFRKNAYIICYSRGDVCNSPLLWSHYTRGHTGVALGFDFFEKKFSNFSSGKINFDDSTTVFEMSYPPRELRAGILSVDKGIEFLEIQNDELKLVNFLCKEMVLNKSKDWDYEKEWRMIMKKLAKEENPSCLLDKAFKSIHLGILMSPQDKFYILSLINKKYPQVESYMAEKHRKYERLIFKKIDIEEELNRLVNVLEPA